MYHVNTWDVDTRNQWTFLPILAFDFALFMTLFFEPDALPIVRIGSIIQFTMSVLACLYYILQHRWGTEKIQNARAESLDLDKERGRLASQQKNVKIGNDAYSQLFKAYHI